MSEVDHSGDIRHWLTVAADVTQTLCPAENAEEILRNCTTAHFGMHTGKIKVTDTSGNIGVSWKRD